MGTAAETLNSRLGLDTTDFKTGLQAANRELRVLESGFRASVSTLGDWANSITGVEERQKSLNAQIDIQKAKVDALEAEHKRLADANGKTSISAKNAEVALNKENERLGKMQTELAGTVTALHNLKNGNDAAGRSTQELQAKQEPLSETFKKSWTEINSMIMVGKMAWATLKKAVDETVGAYVKYADQVREISQVTGASAEETSRLLQVTDDYKIDAEALNTVMKKMATEGFSFTTESLAVLSDEYLQLNSGVERQIFLNEKFGKQGIAFAEIMLQGGAAIRDQAAAISDNLILTEQALVKAREYEIAQDNLNDSLEGMKIAVGERIVPALTDQIDLIMKAAAYTEAYNRAQQLGIKVSTNLYYGYSMINGQYATLEDLLLAIAEAEKEQETAFKKANPEIEIANRYIGNLADSTQNATTQTTMFGFAVLDGVDALQQANNEFGFIISFARQYETNLNNVQSAEEELKTAEEELFAMSQPGWKGTWSEIQTAQDKVDGLKTKLGDAKQAAADATNEMIGTFLQAQLTADGVFSEADIQKVLDYRLAVGLITKEAYAAAKEALKIAENLAKIPDEVNTQINVNTDYTYGGPPPDAEEQAEGGDYYVTRPTLFLAGEAGPERATFTPLNKGMKSALKQFEGAVLNQYSEEYAFYAPVIIQDAAAGTLGAALKAKRY